MLELTGESAEAALRKAIQDSNQDPIPRCIVLEVWLAPGNGEAYLQRLHREMESYAPLLARDRQVVELGFRGAGQSRLVPGQGAELLHSLELQFAPLRIVPAVRDRAREYDLLGLGLGAVSRFGACQTHNAADLPAYCAAIDAGRLPIVSASSAAAH